MPGESTLSRAKDLKDKAKHDTENVTHDEVEELLNILNGEYQEARTVAAGAFDQLYKRPELFEPVAGKLLEFAAYYPRAQDGIPTPEEITIDNDLKEVVFIADGLARVARRDPTMLTAVTDDLVTIMQSDRNYPKYHLITLGMVGAVDPNGVPMDEVTDQLCSLLDTYTHGYAGWAADTLRRIGDPGVLPKLNNQYPHSASDATIEAFDDAIADLEKNR